MPRLLAPLLALSLWADAGAGQAPERPPAAQPVHKGMSAAEVLKLLGPPKRIARQILYRRCREQWSYDAPVQMLIELECVKGQEPRVLSVGPLKP